MRSRRRERKVGRKVGPLPPPSADTVDRFAQESMKMGIGPPHTDLESVVEISDGAVTADQQAAPYHRADAPPAGYGIDQATAAGSRTDRRGGDNMSRKGYEIGSGNVFKDIGVPNAEEHFVKAQLVYKIDTIMKQRGLKQVEAAGLFGVRQPDISKMLRGEFRQFSVERLLRFLVALEQDVDIVVKPHRGKSNAPALHVY